MNNNMNNKGIEYNYILTRSTSGRLHTCKNASSHMDWVKIGVHQGAGALC